MGHQSYDMDLYISIRWDGVVFMLVIEKQSESIEGGTVEWESTEAPVCLWYHFTAPLDSLQLLWCWGDGGLPVLPSQSLPHQLSARGVGVGSSETGRKSIQETRRAGNAERLSGKQFGSTVREMLRVWRDFLNTYLLITSSISSLQKRPLVIFPEDLGQKALNFKVCL